MQTFRMAAPYDLPHWPFVVPAELLATQQAQSNAEPAPPISSHPIVIVGAGLAGLTLACDLAVRGIRSVLIDEDDTIGVRGASSRGICYAQKSLEIFERLGLVDRILERGITWSVGRTLSGLDEVYQFNLQLQSQSAQPPFVNLQQFYIEWFLVERILELGLTDIRWKHRLTGLSTAPAHDPQASTTLPPLRGEPMRLQLDTPAGSYALDAELLIDATGANSLIREQLGLDAHTSRSTDRWCISDVRFTKPLPTERWTWVDAPFNDGRAVWQHLMGDGVWRMDYQMDEHADPEQISRPEVAGPRLRAQLGPEVEFEFVWIGPYQYRDHLLDDFRYGRVLFIGDAAHVVSPFGARGGNTGIQDANNLGWKLAQLATTPASHWAQHPGAADALLDSYNAERRPAAAENLQVTSRSARFLAPRSRQERLFRQAAISLAREHAFAKPLVNTGRMSEANDYPPAPLLPQGARSVQNVRLRQAATGEAMTLMSLLRAPAANTNTVLATPPHWLLLVIAPTAAMQAALEQSLADATEPMHAKVRWQALGGSSSWPTLHLDAIDTALPRLDTDQPIACGDVLAIRPDAYLALHWRGYAAGDGSPNAPSAPQYLTLRHALQRVFSGVATD